ncbi:DUF4912 domain-containing protein [Clostridium kluyveri]|uniref:DUF4912 domain-containing protein n=1 Tax=Clostridium kluyveri TaxID=1534 RepID=A0A1L5FC65_CLOKL|nr:DUF4912 domain-containing protein [Clostridium kluyveri]
MKGVNSLRGDEKTSLVLMVQNSHRIFCYYNVSSMTVKEFEDRYGEALWINSKPVIKVYSVEDGIAKNIETIFIDPFADSWYIDIEKDDMDLFVKLGRIISGNKFVEFAVSNTVTTPRNSKSLDNSLYFLDVSQSNISNLEKEFSNNFTRGKKKLNIQN